MLEKVNLGNLPVGRDGGYKILEFSKTGDHFGLRHGGLLVVLAYPELVGFETEIGGSDIADFCGGLHVECCGWCEVNSRL